MLDANGEAKPYDYAVLYAHCLTAAANATAAVLTGAQPGDFRTPSVLDIKDLADDWFKRAMEVGHVEFEYQDTKRRGKVPA